MNPFGPILIFELARVVRRQRPILSRCLYVLLLLVLLGFVYLSIFGNSGPRNIFDFLFRATANPKDMANFGYIFFIVFACVQHAIGTLATAASTAAILAEEKERRTLPFLLTTTLHDREIVFGKLAARVAQILMVLLAGLPVLAIMQVMGGVDPLLLASAFLATGASVVSTAGIGAALSITAPSVRIATGRSVGLIAFYLAIFPIVSGIMQAIYGHFTIVVFPTFAITIGDVVDWLNSGNMYWVISMVGRRLTGRMTIDSVLIPLMWRYVIFHGIIAVTTMCWSAFRLRKTLTKESDRAVNKVSRKTGLITRGGRKPVSQTRPVYWRETETAIGRGADRTWVRWFKRLAFVVAFLPMFMALFEGLQRGRFYEPIHGVTRVFGTIALALSLLIIANAAASMIGRERRQKTIDELCLTDLRNREILYDKAIASVLTGRWFWVYVGIHWLIAIPTGCVSLFALILVPPLYLLYAISAVRLGIVCSVYETSRIKAGPAAVLVMLVLAILPWILPMSHAMIFGGHRAVEYTACFAAGLSYPVAIGFLTLAPRKQDNPFDRPGEAVCFAIGLMIGLTFHWAMSAYGWRAAKARFASLRRE